MRNSNFDPLSYSKILQRRSQAAQGNILCDLILKNVVYFDVFSCVWREGEIAIHEGVIVGVTSGLKGKRAINLKNQKVVPGFIDSHVHVESSMMSPFNFEESVLKKGTTTAICDPHELANVLGPFGINYFLNSSSSLNLDLWVMLSSCVPATHLETNGGGEILAEDLLQFAQHPKTLGLAEMMNVPGVLQSDPEILKKLSSFSQFPMDGHCPLLTGEKLSAYAATGISSCHESTEFEEAREKLSKGISIWIREGSVAKDLKAIAPLLTLATSTSIGFCTDDRNPLDIANEGHIDHLIRSAIQLGIPSEVAYRSASWSPARHYGLTSGPGRIGALAPGYQADLVILGDAQTCSIVEVIKSGQLVSEIESKRTDLVQFENSIDIKSLETVDLEGPVGNVHVIGVLEGKIITEHRIKDSRAEGVAKLSVLERYGNGSPPANAYVEGFGLQFKGAIASSVGHDSHNLIVVGNNSADMKIALKALAESGGGFAVVQSGTLLAHLALPIGGLMSRLQPSDLKKSLEILKAASRSIGCELNEPFLQLAFLSLPVIPSLKLTDRGLVDVNAFKFIDVRAG